MKKENAAEITCIRLEAYKREDQLDEVQEAWLESNGKVSALKNTRGKPARKQGLKLLQ